MVIPGHGSAQPFDTHIDLDTMLHIRPVKTLSQWLLVAIVGLAAGVAYAGPDKDKDGDRKPRDPAAVSAAKAAQNACSVGEAFADLDVNNVRARLYNTGNLFYGSAGTAGTDYEIPRGSGLSPIFAHGIWVGGQADGELRMAAATYAQGNADYEFFPGPINDDGTVPSPNDCSPFDRIWKVSLEDVEAFERGEDPTTDLLEWPFELGAGVIDGDGNPDNYNLQGGDRPEILGDQTLFWVMNDAGGSHQTTLTAPIGLEVRATAFAFATADALNNTTFYKYEMIYKPADGRTLQDVYFGLWSDPDLGQPSDDYVGSDTTLGLGFVYNGDNFDEGSTGYQGRPPAVGYDFFQGPLVDSDGDGVLNEELDERLKMTRFVYYNNVNGAVNGNPADADDFYGYLRGLWTDGSRMTYGGDGEGDDLGEGPTNFMFTGEPPNFWSEDNTDRVGSRNVPADRRFLMSTGPFTMQPGDRQELVFGIVFSQTANRIGSVRKLKADDILAQGAFDFDFNLPRPPAAPRVQATELNGSIVLSWNNLPTDNNYLNSYDEESAFLVSPEVADNTFTFEGYKIYQYASPSDFPDNGEVIATLDVSNNVTTIVQNAIDPETGAPIQEVVAVGSDSGVQNFLVIDQDFLTDQPLRNYTQYYYGVQAYAYNAFSDPPIYASPIAGSPDGSGPIVAVPTRVDVREGGTVLNARPQDVLVGEIGKLSDAIIQARIVDPLAVTGDTYQTRFYIHDPEGEGEPFLTYDLVNTTTGDVLLKGDSYYDANGTALPIGNDVALFDGLSFTVVDAPAAIAGGGAGIVEITYAGAPAPIDAGGAPYNGNSVWHALNSNADYFISGASGSGIDNLERWVDFAAPRDFEMRFTEEGGYCVHAFDNDMVGTVPFEIWDIGIGTPDDPSDDVRMIPFCLGGPAGETYPDWTQSIEAGAVDGWGGYPVWSAIYWMDPYPGDGGYEAFHAVAEATGAGNIYPFASDGSTDGYFANFYGGFVYPIGRFAIADYEGFAGGEVGTPPPPGTTIRVNHTKPIAAGDVFTFDTAPLAATRDDAETLEEGLDAISIVPNPYRGASSYDVSTFQNEVRFTNLPERATIRAYTLSGTLVRTLEKVPGTDYLAWDMRTEDGLPIASGIYLMHIEVPGVGERVMKFGAVTPPVRLNIF